METTECWDKVKELLLPECSCEECTRTHREIKKKLDSHPQLGDKLLQVCDLVESLRACMVALPLSKELKQAKAEGMEVVKIPAISMLCFTGLLHSFEDPKIVGEELEHRVDCSIKIFQKEREVWLGVLKENKNVPWA